MERKVSIDVETTQFELNSRCRNKITELLDYKKNRRSYLSKPLNIDVETFEKIKSIDEIYEKQHGNEEHGHGVLAGLSVLDTLQVEEERNNPNYNPISAENVEIQVGNYQIDARIGNWFLEVGHSDKGYLLERLEIISKHHRDVKGIVLIPEDFQENYEILVGTVQSLQYFDETDYLSDIEDRLMSHDLKESITEIYDIIKDNHNLTSNDLFIGNKSSHISSHNLINIGKMIGGWKQTQKRNQSNIVEKEDGNKIDLQHDYYNIKVSNEKIIGILIADFDGRNSSKRKSRTFSDNPHIYTVYVDPAHRNQGIGTELVNEFAEEVEKKIVIHINPELKPFYNQTEGEFIEL